MRSLDISIRQMMIRIILCFSEEGEKRMGRLRKFVTRNVYPLLFVLFLLESVVYAATQPPRPADPQARNFPIAGEVRAILERKIGEERLQAIMNGLSSQTVSIAQITERMRRLGVPAEVVESTRNELDAYQALVAAVQASEPVIARMEQIGKEQNTLKEALPQAQSEEEKARLNEKIQRLSKKLATQRSQLDSILTRMRYEDLERLERVFEDLAYSDEQKERSARYIRAHIEIKKKLDTLQTIRRSIKDINKEIEKSTQQYTEASTPQDKSYWSNQLEKLNQRRDSLLANFINVSSGTDADELFNKKEEKTDIRADLLEVFSPIVNELKALSEKPRRMEKMKSDLIEYQDKLKQVDQALENIERLSQNNSSRELQEDLDNLAEYWQRKRQELSSLREATQRKIDAELEKEVPLGQAMKEAVASFFKERGQHLFFSILAFVLTYMLFRFFQRLFYRYNPLRKNDAYMIWANLADLAFGVMTFVAATGAMLVVLYLSGDWLILSIVGLVFLGLAWAARNTLPSYLEQVRLLLNFGPVRQGELVTINGIPWKVESIGVYSYFVNPLLTGGVLRLPLQDLIGMRSRPFDPREPLFPCKEGDYILLDGNQWRQIHLQTPEEVQFRWYDMIERMPTRNFIGRNLFNISMTPFWAGGSFQIAYHHRYAVRNEITKQLRDFVDAFAKSRMYGKHLIYTWIEFGKCTEHALEFMVWLQLAPEAAEYYDRVLLDINQVCLDAANHYHWEILRFQTIDVHMAAPKDFSPHAIDHAAS